MCEKVEAALEVVKQSKKSLTKGEIVMVFQQVVYDLNKQGERMKNLEKNFEEMNTKLQDLTIDVQKILVVVEGLKQEKKPSIWERIPILKEIPMPVWLILWTIVTGLFCLLGVNPSFLQYIKGG